MSVVRRDVHGLYVKTGGYIFRPQVSCWARGATQDAKPSMVGGEKVRARHYAGTVFANVDGQTWFSHGSYYAEWADQRGIVPQLQSEICWAPVGVERCRQTVFNGLTGERLTCTGPVQYGESTCRHHLLERAHPVEPEHILVIQEQP